MGVERIDKPVELLGFDAAANLAGNAGIEGNDMNAGENLVVEIWRAKIGLTAEHAAIKAFPRVMIADQPDHRQIDSGPFKN